jgi:hypothetical protein
MRVSCSATKGSFREEIVQPSELPPVMHPFVGGKQNLLFELADAHPSPPRRRRTRRAPEPKRRSSEIILFRARTCIALVASNRTRRTHPRCSPHSCLMVLPTALHRFKYIYFLIC